MCITLPPLSSLLSSLSPHFTSVKWPDCWWLTERTSTSTVAVTVGLPSFMQPWLVSRLWLTKIKMSKYSQSNSLSLLVAMQVTRQWSSFCCLLEVVQRWVHTTYPSPEGGGGGRGGRREPVPLCLLSTNGSCFTLSPSSVPPLTSPSSLSPLSLPPLTGGGLSWQCSAGESGTSYGGNQRPAHLPGEERESRGEGEELEAKYPCMYRL